jgi:hypothetical protein
MRPLAGIDVLGKIERCHRMLAVPDRYARLAKRTRQDGSRSFSTCAPEEAAMRFGGSPLTIRNQLSAGMAKLGVRRRADLATLLSSLLPALSIL